MFMSADIPTKGLSGNFMGCYRMPTPKNGATHFIEIDYKTAVGLDDANTKILKSEIAEFKSKISVSGDSTRSRR
jgi:hypothetical protein